jgi:cephalosporin-C deacetylase-like acetyl esterase
MRSRSQNSWNTRTLWTLVVLTAISFATHQPAAMAEESNTIMKNYWTVDGGRMAFNSADMTLDASLPAGFESLKVQGQEFLQGGKGYGGMAFRRADGTFITHFVNLDNTSHDALQGRMGSVSDGEYLISVTTGWTLPSFEIYAGYNNTDAVDLVLFCHPDVRAIRMFSPNSAISSSPQSVLKDGKPGTAITGEAVAIVSSSGAVLRVSHGPVSAGVITAPDGAPRLAVVVPLKGMAANTIACAYDTNNRTDSLLARPLLTVDSPTMGQADTGYKPQSNGYWTLYEKGAKLDYAVTFDWLGSKPFSGNVVIEARHALGQPHMRLEVKPEKVSEQNGVTSYRAVARPEFTMPGVSEVNVHLQDSDGVVLMTERLRIMYDWPSYKAKYNAQPDIKQFWDSTLAELAKVPLDPKVEEVLFKDDPNWEFLHVSFNGWKGKRIHACVYIPKSAKSPLPVMITAHPGTLGFGANHRADGTFGSQVNLDPRFVTIVPLIRGFEPDANDIPFNDPWWGPLDNRDDYVARSWYCALVRGLDYMATRKDIADMTKVVSSGGSQGGALSLVTAALDKRVKLCISWCPSNCMLSDSVRPGTYSTFGPSSGQVPPGQTLDDLLRTLSYYDAANMAPRITCPTVIQVNVGDLTVHSMGGLGVFKNLTNLPADKKWFMPGVNGNQHDGSHDGRVKSEELIKQLIGK